MDQEVYIFKDSSIRWSLIIRYGFLSLIILLSPVSIAKDSDTDSTYSLSTEDLWRLSLEDILNLRVDTLRDSFSKAIRLKRITNTISDTIVAEDIGKMPDRNIAEALQRISGVSIARSKGEGTFVTIRGIADNLNVTLINGQTVASAGDGRGIDFSIMPASMISAIEIYKTPKASDIEGSIGGTINIVTSRPLDVGTEKGSLFVEYSHDNFNQENSPSISFSYIKPVNRYFGIATAISYEKFDARTRK